MATRETQVSPNSQAIDLSVPRPKPLTEASTSQSCSSDLRVPKPAHQHHSAPEGSSNTKKKKLNNAHNLVDGKNGKRRQVNIFKKHKLKYQYLNKKHRHEKSKHTSDSGQFGSSSMQGSSSTTSMDKRSTNDSTSSLYTSSSPSSGTSDSPLNLASSENQGSSTTSTATTGNDSPMCMMLRHAVPLVVMMQGQLQSSQNDGVAYSETTLYKCNMCSMFSNNLTDVLSHVKSNHATVHYCFVCSQFHSTRTEFDRHRNVCATAHQAFQQIVDNHYMNQQSNPQNSSNSGGTQDQALNLSIAGNVAMRAAQMIHSKKGRQKKIKKLQKCTYCKKAFFGRFYLQRHLRSHTGEKLCHCTICGKGFYEWRNLRNHMSRFHNSSQSSESGGQSKSVSPNITSDSDQRNSNRGGAYHTGTSGSSGSTSGIQADKSSSGSGGSGFVGGSGGSQTTNSSKSSETSGNPQRGEGQSVALSRSMEFTHPNDLTNTWTTPSASAAAEHMISSEDYNRSSSAASNSYISKSNIKISSSPGNASSVNSETNHNPYMSDGDKSNGLPESKPVAANLGSTSSRLQLSKSEQGFEKSLQPVCTENGDKIFQCSLCDKIFRTKFAMQRHLDFHADKRPYQCDQCDYKAKTKPQLKVHVMRHSGEKGFHCSICNYACVTHSDLNRHCKSRSHLFRVSVLENKGLSMSSAAISTPKQSGDDSTRGSQDDNNDDAKSDR